MPLGVDSQRFEDCDGKACAAQTIIVPLKIIVPFPLKCFFFKCVIIKLLTVYCDFNL